MGGEGRHAGGGHWTEEEGKAGGPESAGPEGPGALRMPSAEL